MVDDYDVGGNHRKAYMLTVSSLRSANADDKDSDIFYIAAEIGKEIDTHMTNFIRTGHSGRKWRREIADSKAETMVTDMYSHNSRFDYQK